MRVDDQLKFLVRFTQIDLNHFRRGDWLNLMDDINNFVIQGEIRLGEIPTITGRSSGIVVHCEEKLTEESAEKSLPQLQKKTVAVLNDMLKNRSLTYEKQNSTIQPDGGFLTIEATLQNSLVPNVSAPFRNYQVLRLPNFSSAWLFSVSNLLSEESTEKIRRCPMCSKIFFRIKKQEYCSRQCTNRATVARWRRKIRAEADSEVDLLQKKKVKRQKNDGLRKVRKHHSSK